jgi:hypothetical protein
VKEFPIDNAVLKAVNNTVTVFIGLENTELDLNQLTPKDGTAAQTTADTA